MQSVNELHGVVNGHAARHDSAGRVDVKRDLLLRILGLQEQELGADQRGHAVFHRAGNEDDPLLEEPREDVIGAFAAVRLLDDHRHKVHRGLDGVGH